MSTRPNSDINYESSRRCTLTGIALSAVKNNFSDVEGAASLGNVNTAVLSVNLIKLRKILIKKFNESELNDLYFDVGVSKDILPRNANKKDIVLELITYTRRHNLLVKLMYEVDKSRKSIQTFEEVRKIVD